MADFKEGDVVQLKSGGPPMTIKEIADYSVDESGSLSASCVWFDGKNPCTGIFPLPALQKVSP